MLIYSINIEDDQSEINKIINNNISADIEVQTLTYKGHDYIMFKNGYRGRFSTMGVEHDPDCKACKNR